MAYGLGLDAVAHSLAFGGMHTSPNTTKHVRLPAEWELSGAIMLAWPSAESDWAPWLAAARNTVSMMARSIAPTAQVLLLTDDEDSVKDLRAELGQQLIVVDQPMNDTWTRDYGPITVLVGDEPVLLDFGFNGWGLKFAADQDNQTTQRLHAGGHFGQARRHVPGLWLEGGSIESDGQGTLLTTSACLLSPNRNPHLDREAVNRLLGDVLGGAHVLWLEHGHLQGDDTDSHIDTIARLCPNDTIAYVRCDDANDDHYADFTAMEQELQALRTRQGQPFHLVPLPWATAKHASDGHRLPATYANYLVVNNTVLMPTYADPQQDALAIKQIQNAFPGYDVIGINCTVLIEQHGSLHCMTMQIPSEVYTWTR